MNNKITKEEVEESIKNIGHSVVLDEAYKYRVFKHKPNLTFSCKKCQNAFSVNPDDVVCYRFIEKPYDKMVYGIRLTLKEEQNRYAVCTECPECKRHLVVWWY